MCARAHTWDVINSDCPAPLQSSASRAGAPGRVLAPCLSPSLWKHSTCPPTNGVSPGTSVVFPAVPVPSINSHLSSRPSLLVRPLVHPPSHLSSQNRPLHSHPCDSWGSVDQARPPPWEPASASACPQPGHALPSAFLLARCACGARQGSDTRPANATSQLALLACAWNDEPLLSAAPRRPPRLVARMRASTRAPGRARA